MIWVISIISILIITGLVSALFILKNQQLKKQLEWQEKYIKLESKINSLELETIKSKLNPHLFKNTLNSIQSHAYQTYYALDKLSGVLDFILYESDRKFVSLKEELDFALNLIEINRLKLSPLFDLRIKNKIQPEVLDQNLPIAPLISIDLIENAFKHADLSSEDSFIAIVFELKNDQFILTVSNKISRKLSIRKDNGGVGRENLKKRLQIVYPDRHKLDQFTENDIYIAHLKIDLVDDKAKVSVIG